MAQFKPRGVRDDIYAAMDQVADEMPQNSGGQAQMGAPPPTTPPRRQSRGPSVPPGPNLPGPEWLDQATGPMHQAGPGPYETGDPEIDAVNRTGRLEGPAQDDPFAAAYTNPAEATRILKGAHYAGISGDDAEILQIINGPYGQSPMGRLIARSYYDGKKKRQQRR